MIRRVFPALLVGTLAAAASGPSTTPAANFLASAFDVTAGDLGKLNAGQIISRTLPVKDSREIAILAVARMRLTPEFYVQQMSDIVRFKHDDAVAQIGRFGTPPVLRDLEGLTLEEPDLKSLADCRVGHCGVQFSAGALEQFRSNVSWRSPSAEQQANTLMRQVLLGYVAEYQRKGVSASIQYADQHPLVDVEREFASLADENGDLWKQLPTLRQHLAGYPGHRAPGSTDIVYWSKEKLGRKPVVSVTHLAIVRTAGESPAEYAVASKQLYGSHYFDASLGLTVLVQDSSPPGPNGPATYVVYLNRSRVDVFGGLFGGMIRKIVTSRARSGAADQLGRLQRRLEGQFATHESS